MEGVRVSGESDGGFGTPGVVAKVIVVEVLMTEVARETECPVGCGDRAPAIVEGEEGGRGDVCGIQREEEGECDDTLSFLGTGTLMSELES